MAWTGDRDELIVVMARLGEGDGTAIGDLVRLGGSSLRAAMGRHLARLGAPVSAEVLDDLVVDAAIELAGIAGSWDPSKGALPWVWAERRLMGIAVAHVGQYADPIGEADDPVAEARVPDRIEGEIDLRVVLDELAARDARAASLVDRLRVVSPRDAHVWLDYRVEQSCGNPAPSCVVAATHGLSPAAVRKIAQRVQARVGERTETAA